MNTSTWTAINLALFSVLFADVARLIRRSDADLFRAGVCVYAAVGDLLLDHEVAMAVFWVALCGWNIYDWWKHRNDHDDDMRRRRRRLRAWAKSKLPRPVARVLRNPA